MNADMLNRGTQRSLSLSFCFQGDERPLRPPLDPPVNYTVKIRFSRKKILNYAYVLKNGVGRYNIFFFYFYTKLAESSFLCRFRIESVNVFVLPRFDLCHVLSSSTNNFAHAQTLSRMSSLSGRMNSARVNIVFFTVFKT